MSASRPLRSRVTHKLSTWTVLTSPFIRSRSRKSTPSGPNQRRPARYIMSRKYLARRARLSVSTTRGGCRIDRSIVRYPPSAQAPRLRPIRAAQPHLANTLAPSKIPLYDIMYGNCDCHGSWVFILSSAKSRLTTSPHPPTRPPFTHRRCLLFYEPDR